MMTDDWRNEHETAADAKRGGEHLAILLANRRRVDATTSFLFVYRSEDGREGVGSKISKKQTDGLRFLAQILHERMREKGDDCH